MQTFDEADIAELAQVAREERMRKSHPEWFDVPSIVSDDCVVSEDNEEG